MKPVMNINDLTTMEQLEQFLAGCTALSDGLACFGGVS
jgi:hypothetical protein